VGMSVLEPAPVRRRASVVALAHSALKTSLDSHFGLTHGENPPTACRHLAARVVPNAQRTHLPTPLLLLPAVA
jgi:hypothetical protein